MIPGPAYPLVFMLNDVPIGMEIKPKVVADPVGLIFETEPLANVIAPEVIVKLILLDPAESALVLFGSGKSEAQANAQKANLTVSGGK